MKKMTLALVCVSIVAGISAKMKKDIPYAAKVTIDNQTNTTAYVELEKGDSLGEISSQVRPGKQRTFVSKDKCFDEIEVRLGKARVFDRREKEAHGTFCGISTIQIIPDNSEKGFSLKVIKGQEGRK